jgi:hypothetical protein
MNIRLTRLVLALALVPAPASAQNPAPAPDPIAAANAAARAEYARARSAMLAHVGPVIVVYEGDKVALLRNGARAEKRFVAPSDADLKGVAHVPLGLFTALDTLGDGPVAAERLAALAHLRDTVAAARSALDGRGFAAATLDRQRRILDASLELVDTTISRKQARRADALAFARRMAPLVLANVTEAARAQIDGLHAVVSAWRREMTADEWRALRVVVIGVHMARDEELATQYFLRLLGEPAEGRRVVYAEGLWDESRALDLLGTHMIDGRVGAAFFGEDLRMHRDVLGDAAKAYLDELGVEP